ncbi:66-phosphogluconolactonase-like [Octopus vulgaris]|uniref:66-phosphogluconolactonase-like n=2 Tax=Octopus TaxID=6643 RepID=A0AA36F8S6_OCTVU|nr:6-phosphogluconolactonase-like [Octopus sinensis]CAI9728449.1 66-phosphogluconolactonase-like [Octopus vulgaris]
MLFGSLKMAPTRVVSSSGEDLEQRLADLLTSKSEQALKSDRLFIIGVSGGSVSKYLCNTFCKLSTNWAKWRIFFCDERYVPHEDPECTYKYYKENFLSKVKDMSADHIYPIKADLPIDECAKNYSDKIAAVFDITPGTFPRFDVVLLGMGPDGHTCSLFPGHHLLDEKVAVVSPISDSPKPPPGRVTLTLPVLNRSACAVFMATGENKAELVRKALEPVDSDGDMIPAGRVSPVDGELIWFLDAASAKQLKH